MYNTEGNINTTYILAIAIVAAAVSHVTTFWSLQSL